MPGPGALNRERDFQVPLSPYTLHILKADKKDKSIKCIPVTGSGSLDPSPQTQHFNHYILSYTHKFLVFFYELAQLQQEASSSLVKAKDTIRYVPFLADSGLQLMSSTPSQIS